MKVHQLFTILTLTINIYGAAGDCPTKHGTVYFSYAEEKDAVVWHDKYNLKIGSNFLPRSDSVIDIRAIYERRLADDKSIALQDNNVSIVDKKKEATELFPENSDFPHPVESDSILESTIVVENSTLDQNNYDELVNVLPYSDNVTVFPYWSLTVPLNTKTISMGLIQEGHVLAHFMINLEQSTNARVISTNFENYSKTIDLTEFGIEKSTWYHIRLVLRYTSEVDGELIYCLHDTLIKSCAKEHTVCDSKFLTSEVLRDRLTQDSASIRYRSWDVPFALASVTTKFYAVPSHRRCARETDRRPIQVSQRKLFHESITDVQLNELHNQLTYRVQSDVSVVLNVGDRLTNVTMLNYLHQAPLIVHKCDLTNRFV